MKLLDSNIIIYSYLDEFKYLRQLMLENNIYVSEISRLEVLGFHRLSKEEETYFNDLFSELSLIEVDKSIIDDAIQKRKIYNLKLGDSIIAATARVHNLELFTRNLEDFEKIAELKVTNPIL